MTGGRVPCCGSVGTILGIAENGAREDSPHAEFVGPERFEPSTKRSPVLSSYPNCRANHKGNNRRSALTPPAFAEGEEVGVGTAVQHDAPGPLIATTGALWPTYCPCEPRERRRRVRYTSAHGIDWRRYPD
jgi:hypothetical protein